MSLNTILKDGSNTETGKFNPQTVLFDDVYLNNVKSAEALATNSDGKIISTTFPTIPSQVQQGYIYGLEHQTLAKTIGVKSGAVAVLNGSEYKTLTYTSASTTIDCATVGVNGLDTGSLQASRWYAIWAIGSSTDAKTPAFVCSLTFGGNPTYPSGYDLSRVIGFARTGATTVPSINFLQYIMQGRGNSRYYDWADETDSLTDFGIVVSSASASQSNIDAQKAMPLQTLSNTWTGKHVKLMVSFLSDTPGDRVTVYSEDAPTTWKMVTCLVANRATQMWIDINLANDLCELAFDVTGAGTFSTSIYALGFVIDV